ncbi:hypothetical protein [Sorangium cellulosum]|uniref:hypothetical protein n=1 Tax=Sorangium cellulosum TaxID=56 RepID=UPI001F282006|nr:hypothetical protein [Sorangium cellulosum]
MALLLGALAGGLVFSAASAASAADGAGLFALPPSRPAPADRAATPSLQPPETSPGPVLSLVERAIEVMVAPNPAHVRVVPLMSRGGGGLSVVLPVCEEGCARYATRGVLLTTPRGLADSPSPLAWLTALGGRGAHAVIGPPGLAALRDDARSARAKMPQEEENALPE